MAKSMIGVKPLNNRVLVGIFDDGETNILLGGKKFYLLDDTSFAPDLKRNRTRDKHKGIRPRYAIVLATPDGDETVKPGEKVLLEFGEWSRGVPVCLDGKDTKVWSIPVEKILGIIGYMEFNDQDKEQIGRLYPSWDEWEVKEF